MSQTVLLVDDNRNVLAAFRRAFHQESYRLLVATSADEALIALAARPIDVVVSDDAMPGMSGTALLARVHAQYPETIRIMLTGQASLTVAIRAINEGAVYRFFTKPCDPTHLATTIRHALQERALMRQSRRLLQTLRRQAAATEELERDVCGVTRVTRDDSGAIIVDDSPTDIEALLEEMEHEVDVANARLRRGGTTA